jgi:cytochrome c oxidase assembly protein subunit 15
MFKRLLNKKLGIDMTIERYRLLNLLTSIFMFVVLIAGVIVTNTESGEGCGTDWPLCHGKFIPAYTLESMIEYSHRLVTGIVTIFVAASFFVTVFWKPARCKESVWYASLIVFFTLLQAALGAAAVLWPQSDAVMALHFGISLFAFTSTWLLYAYSDKWARSGEPRLAGVDASPAHRSVFWFTITAIVYCYVVIYLGAYIRHTGTGGACSGWPLCNGKLLPPLEGAVAIAISHRFAAALMLLLVIALMIFVRSRFKAGSGPAKLATNAFWLILLQILSGGLLALTMGDRNLYVFTELFHTIVICGLFTVLCLLALRTWPQSAK